jgi:hypothetical protein
MLVVGILNMGTPSKIVPGITMSSPDQCANPSVLAALCMIQTNNSQGVEHLEFKIGGILGNSLGLGNWFLNITAALTTSNSTLVQNSVSSISFTITVAPLLLTVQVPAGIAASVDGAGAQGAADAATPPREAGDDGAISLLGEERDDALGDRRADAVDSLCAARLAAE